jgi:hypothetical protein
MYRGFRKEAIKWFVVLLAWVNAMDFQITVLVFKLQYIAVEAVGKHGKNMK